MTESRTTELKLSTSLDKGSTSLKRELTTCHLTFMGIASTIGAGIYVLVGVGAKIYAVPGIIFSFLLAGTVTFLNALSFAELGAGISKTGAINTFVYTHTSQGAAFLVGWVNMVGVLAGTGVGAQTWSGYVDSLFHNSIQNFSISYIGGISLGEPFTANTDLLAGFFVMFAICVLMFSVKLASRITTITASVSIVILLFVSVVGFVCGKTEHLQSEGHVDFIPFGVGGVIRGTTVCFYAYLGFNVICMSAEEAKTPQTSQPLAIVMELLIVSVLYTSTAAAIILLEPYTLIDEKAPISSALDYAGLQWAKPIPVLGAAIAIGQVIVLGLYSFSRHMYCMSRDGLLPEFCSRVHGTQRIPRVSVAISGSLSTICALIVDIKSLLHITVLSIFVNFIIVNVILIKSRMTGRVSWYRTRTEPQNFDINKLVCHLNENKNRIQQVNGTYSETALSEECASVLGSEPESEETHRPGEMNPQSSCHGVNSRCTVCKHSRCAIHSPLIPVTHSMKQKVPEHERNFNAGVRHTLQQNIGLFQTNSRLSDDCTCVMSRAGNDDNQWTMTDSDTSDYDQVPVMDNTEPLLLTKCAPKILHEKMNVVTNTTRMHLKKNTVSDQVTRNENSSTSMKTPSKDLIISWALISICLVASAALSIQIIIGYELFLHGCVLTMFLTGVMFVCLATATVKIYYRSFPSTVPGFQVPLVPFLPVSTIILDMMMLISAAESSVTLGYLVLVGTGVLFYLCHLLKVRISRRWSSKRREAGVELQQLLIVDDEEQEMRTLQ